MTPLFNEIVKRDLVTGAKLSVLHWHPMLRHLGGAACFEVSDVFSLAVEMAQEFILKGNVEDIGFLPAPVTWIEHLWSSPKQAYGSKDKIEGYAQLFTRKGVLLRETGKGVFEGYQVSHHRQVGGPVTRESDIEVEPVRYDIQAYMHGIQNWDGEALAREELRAVLAREGEDPDAAADESLIDLYDNYSGSMSGGLGNYPLPSHLTVLLSLINSPKIIGRVAHHPHKGLVKRIKKAGQAARFPLQAWTEIKLRATAPETVDGVADAGSLLTGPRAFHFCRAHMRIRLGRLEFVRAHTRGDITKGVKRSRYTVKK